MRFLRLLTLFLLAAPLMAQTCGNDVVTGGGDADYFAIRDLPRLGPDPSLNWDGKNFVYSCPAPYVLKYRDAKNRLFKKQPLKEFTLAVCTKEKQ